MDDREELVSVASTSLSQSTSDLQLLSAGSSSVISSSTSSDLEITDIANVIQKRARGKSNWVQIREDLEQYPV